MGGNAIADAVGRGASLAGLATVVDIHAHYGPYHNFRVPAHDIDAMLRQMGRTGTEAIVLAPHLLGNDPFTGNDTAIDLARRHPGKVFGYAVPYPHEPQRARDELDRAMDAGLVAIKLHPAIHRCSIYDPGYSVAWEVARERHTFILSHTWHNSPECAPKLFVDMAKQYPDVPIILGHSGGVPAGFREAIGLAQQYPNLYLDTCGSYVTGAWVRRMVQEVGADRVVYGTDLPFIDSRYGLGKVALSGLAPDQLRLVLGLNAKRLLAAAGAQLR